MIERERKYLVLDKPDLTGLKPENIRQGYYALDDQPGHDPLRIRQRGTSFELTKKFQIEPGNYGLSREETIPLSEPEFNQLWPATLYHLTKDRYRFPYANWTIELDCYKDGLAGFMVAEVEFESQNDEETFQPPTWFGPEITAYDWATNTYFARVERTILVQKVEALGVKLPKLTT